ncbi:hypothetical protein AAVH_41184, partial [Aphelenchoides avenae]
RSHWGSRADGRSILRVHIHRHDARPICQRLQPVSVHALLEDVPRSRPRHFPTRTQGDETLAGDHDDSDHNNWERRPQDHDDQCQVGYGRL